MNPFQIWLDAVDKALANSGKKITTKQLDPATLQRSFQSGMSPVIFAGQVQAPSAQTQASAPMQAHPVSAPIPSQPLYPNNVIVKITFWTMTICGWFAWILGVIMSLWSMAILLRLQQAAGETRAGDVAAAMVILGTWAGIFLIGCFLHYFAQRLAMAHYEFMSRGKP